MPLFSRMAIERGNGRAFQALKQTLPGPFGANRTQTAGGSDPVWTTLEVLLQDPSSSLRDAEAAPSTPNSVNVTEAVAARLGTLSSDVHYLADAQKLWAGPVVAPMDHASPGVATGASAPAAHGMANAPAHLAMRATADHATTAEDDHAMTADDDHATTAEDDNAMAAPAEHAVAAEDVMMDPDDYAMNA